ncbi:hypothetical protein RHGRI_003211 [Rhododendron griersonianum]|uniref:CG-1 domain-containing protein n=1 Tax=Rhododendron griersonianum TaxID=479676 RepID=A0AAV6L6M0_9ERIC|nr:hypothetical protein RHGRI_003211 [Rhododendron griersonianum]
MVGVPQPENAVVWGPIPCHVSTFKTLSYNAHDISLFLIGIDLVDLDVVNIMDEAKARWLRPNEIHAILCNYKYFSINVKPVNLPKSK